MSTVLSLPPRWRNARHVLLLAPVGLLVAGHTPGREGELRHRCLQQQTLHHRGAGQQEPSHLHCHVLGRRSGCFDGGVRVTHGSVAPRQRDADEVVHAHSPNTACLREPMTQCLSFSCCHGHVEKLKKNKTKKKTLHLKCLLSEQL